MRKWILLLVVLLSTTVHADSYALLVNGGYGRGCNYLSFNSTIRESYLNLLDAGYDKANIIVLESDGPDNADPPFGMDNLPWPRGYLLPVTDAWLYVRHWYPDGYYTSNPEYGPCSLVYVDAPKDYDSDGFCDVNYGSTWDDFVTATNVLSGRMTADDSLVIQLIDHGGAGDDGYVFGMWSGDHYGEQVSGSQIAAQLYTIPYAHRIVMTSTCHSGAFADDVANDKTIFMSCSAADEYGWTSVPIVYFQGPKAEELGDGNYYYSDGLNFWDDARCEGMKRLADLNDDGKISWREVWQYSYDNDIFGPVAGPYVDPGSGYVYDIETPQYVDPGGLGDTLFYRIAMPGDANWDNRISNDDLSMLLANWSDCGGWSCGDFTNDGVTNGSDMSILLTNWTTESSGSIMIPEPYTFLVLAVGGILLKVRKKQ